MLLSNQCALALIFLLLINNALFWKQCTMCQAISNKGVEQFWKEKVFFCSMIQIRKFQFWLVKNCTKKKEQYCYHIFVKKKWHLLAKNMFLVSVKLKILHISKLPQAKKKRPKITFLSRARNIVKMESEIYKYLP